MPEDIIRASFKIYDFDYKPEEITKRLGIQPSRTSVKGGLKLVGPADRPAKIIATQNSWSIDSGVDTSENIEKHIDALLSKLAPYAESIAEITRTIPAQFRCTLLFKDDRPGIALSADQLKQITALNAALDLDIYFLENNPGRELE